MKHHVAIRTVLLSALALVLFIAGGAAFWPSEPSYEGKPLSSWLDALPVVIGCTNSVLLKCCPQVRAYAYEEAVAGHERVLVQSETALKAVRALGPRTLPSLTQRLERRDTALSRWTDQAWTCAMRLRLWKRCRVLRDGPTARGQALMAIAELGPAAAPLRAKLGRFAANEPDPGLRAAGQELYRRLEATSIELR